MRVNSLTTLRAPPWMALAVAECTARRSLTSPLSVTIHDVAGRRVRELFTGTAAATVRLRWDGVGDDGRRQPSGVYLLRAVSGAQVLSDRLVILE